MCEPTSRGTLEEGEQQATIHQEPSEGPGDVDYNNRKHNNVWLPFLMPKKFFLVMENMLTAKNACFHRSCCHLIDRSVTGWNGSYLDLMEGSPLPLC